MLLSADFIPNLKTKAIALICGTDYAPVLMAYYCHACGNEQIFEVKVGVKVGRRDSCPHCGVDLHVCKNCQNYDPGLHNMCREPEAAFIRDRAEANFCPHFSFKDSDGWKADHSAEEAKKKLASFFKNLK